MEYTHNQPVYDKRFPKSQLKNLPPTFPTAAFETPANKRSKLPRNSSLHSAERNRVFFVADPPCSPHAVFVMRRWAALGELFAR